MKKRFLSFILVIYPLVGLTQYEFRPIIDSLATCSYFNQSYEFTENPFSGKQVLEIFYIVEKMPSPKASMSEIEDILGKNIQFNKQEMVLGEEIYLQCVVNCTGKAGDFQIIHCPSELVNIGCQLLNVFHDKINTWEPGKQKKINVDTMIKIMVKISNNRFTLIAP